MSFSENDFSAKKEDWGMVYGIVSQLDGDTTRAFMRSKKISAENIFSATNLQVLVQKLKAGDTVVVVNVNRFSTVNQFLVFLKRCQQIGVAVRILAQPYLDMGSGKTWKLAITNFLFKMVEIEHLAEEHMSRGIKMDKTCWEFTCRCFEIMNLEIVSYIFSADGIMKR